MEAQQCVELTSTNRSCGLTITRPWSRSLTMQSRSLSQSPGQRRVREGSKLFDCQNSPDCGGRRKTVFPLSIERGPHPFPFRTRKLSPASAMVLPGILGGRVAREWDLFDGPVTQVVGPFSFKSHSLGDFPDITRRAFPVISDPRRGRHVPLSQVVPLSAEEFERIRIGRRER